MKEQFIPINEANTQRVGIDLSLPPYVEAERIGVNVEKIERLCRLSGIRYLSIQGQNGDVSSFIPTVVGFSKNGEAYAAKTGKKSKVPTYSLDPKKQLYSIFPQDLEFPCQQ